MILSSVKTWLFYNTIFNIAEKWPIGSNQILFLFSIALPRIYLLERRIFGVCDVFCKVAALELLCSSLSLKDIEFQAQLKTPNTLWQTVKKSGEEEEKKKERRGREP